MNEHDLIEEEREINTSKLGTQNYWNEFYNLEIDNYNDSFDQGEIWFGKGLLNKVINWIESKLKSNELSVNSSCLDLGCGNSKFLFELTKLKFQNLNGIDYSANSIKLSNLILNRDYLDYKSSIKFKQLNILEDLDKQIKNDEDWNKFNLIFDKGTYDAICLNPDLPLDQLKAKYKKFLNSVLSSDGLFILCSCNWSKNELINDFVNDKTYLQIDLIDEIKQNSFVFGGQSDNLKVYVPSESILVYWRDEFNYSTMPNLNKKSLEKKKKKKKIE